MGGGLIDVVDAAYCLDVGNMEWLEGVSAQAAAHFPGCLGGVGCHVNTSAEHPTPLMLAGTPGLIEVTQSAHELVESESLRRAYGNKPSSGPSTLHFIAAGEKAPAELVRMYRSYGISELYAVVATNPTSEGIALGLALDPVVYPSIEEFDWGHLLARWDLMALHLDHAASLRGALQSGVAVIDARIDHRGRGEFSELAAPWRDHITATAASHEQLRGQLGDGGDQALWRWSTLLAGLWSVVRRHTSSGRIEYLAIRNPTPLLRRLTPFERQVVELAAAGNYNKSIAVTLGVHETSVSRTLRGALRKLGARSRSDLILLRATLSTEHNTAAL